jgi:hypothetical protein
MTKRQDDSDYAAGPQDQMQTAYGSQQPRRGGYQRQGLAEAAAKSFIRSIASRLGTIWCARLRGGFADRAMSR